MVGSDRMRTTAFDTLSRANLAVDLRSCELRTPHSASEGGTGNCYLGDLGEILQHLISETTNHRESLREKRKSREWEKRKNNASGLIGWGCGSAIVGELAVDRSRLR